MKNNMIITVILVILAAGGGFLGGMKYQQTKTPTQTRQFGQGRNGGRNGLRPIVGEILSSDATSITVKLQDGSSKIAFISDKTSINKASQATRSDLATGARVAVFGQENADGSITAQTISLNPMMRGNGGPPSGPTGAAY